MPGAGEKDVDEEFADVKFRRGENWNDENIKTLTQWAHIAAMSCDLYNESTIYYRNLMRRNTVFNLIVSSFAGIASLSQFSINSQTYEVLTFILKGFFSAASILVALNSGFLKIYEVQERLEGSIRLQNAWTQFGSRLSSEMQLPVALRKDALYMIIKLKETYHELIKDQIQVNKNVLQKVALRNGLSPQALTITDLFERTIQGELMRVDTLNNRDAVITDSNPNPESQTYVPSSEHFIPQRVPSRTFTFFENKKDREIKNLTQQTVVQRNAISNAVMSMASRSYGRSPGSRSDTYSENSDVYSQHNKVLQSIKKKVPVVPAEFGNVGDSSRTLVSKGTGIGTGTGTEQESEKKDTVIHMYNPMLGAHPELPSSDSEDEASGSVGSNGTSGSEKSDSSPTNKYSEF
jgi:hypothetical protein